jgi:hypothetical protein
MSLNRRQSAFAAAFVRCHGASARAALAAGYGRGDVHSAGAHAAALLRRPLVLETIATYLRRGGPDAIATLANLAADRRHAPALAERLLAGAPDLQSRAHKSGNRAKSSSLRINRDHGPLKGNAWVAAAPSTPPEWSL